LGRFSHHTVKFPNEIGIIHGWAYWNPGKPLLNPKIQNAAWPANNTSQPIPWVRRIHSEYPRNNQASIGPTSIAELQLAIPINQDSATRTVLIATPSRP
jgi:hypothetical protein